MNIIIYKTYTISQFYLFKNNCIVPYYYMCTPHYCLHFRINLMKEFNSYMRLIRLFFYKTFDTYFVFWIFF